VLSFLTVAVVPRPLLGTDSNIRCGGDCWAALTGLGRIRRLLARVFRNVL
jgi:hypothetical protein